jgi:hypothetical protein
MGSIIRRSVVGERGEVLPLSRYSHYLSACYTLLMSPETRRAMIALERNIKANTPKVLKKLRQAGVKKPNPALVYTAAKYYECLDRLAKEEN